MKSRLWGFTFGVGVLVAVACGSDDEGGGGNGGKSGADGGGSGGASASGGSGGTGGTPTGGSAGTSTGGTSTGGTAGSAGNGGAGGNAGASGGSAGTGGVAGSSGGSAGAGGGLDASTGGGSGEAGVDAAPDASTPTFSYFLFVPDLYPNDQLATFGFDVSDGSLTRIDQNAALAGQQDIATNSNPIAVGVHPNEKLVYVSNAIDGNVSGYSLDKTNGHLVRLDISSATLQDDWNPAGGAPLNFEFHPNGNFIYGAHNAFVSRGQLDVLSGVVTSQASGTVGTGNAGEIVLDGANGLLFGSSGNDDWVAAFTVNPSTGQLLLIDQDTSVIGQQNFTVFDNPGRMVRHPTLPIAYLTSIAAEQVTTLSWNNAGKLTSLGTVATGDFPTGLAVHPSGTFLYVINVLSNYISTYAIAANGTLTPLPNNTFATNGRGITIDPTGQYLFAGTDTGPLRRYSIDTNTGDLTELLPAVNVSAGFRLAWVDKS